VGAQIVPVVLIVGGGVAALGGVATGTIGGVQIKKARMRIKLQAARHETRHEGHLEAVDRTKAKLQVFGRTQERAQRDVIFRMRDFLLRHEKQVRANEHLIFDGIDGANTHVASMAKVNPDVAGWVQGVVGAAGAGVATPAALRAAVNKFASASTGTPISELSGAAAQKAGLAFLGGGSLKSGGGGMNLGGMARNVATVGPAVLIAGIAVKTQGTKARTDADKHKTDVDVAIARLDARDELLRGVQDRADELDRILGRIIGRATKALDTLESEPFDTDIHAEWLQTALILVKSVREVATAPVADEDGTIDADTDRLIFTYRHADKEPADG